MKALKRKRRRKPKLYGMRKYWPHLTEKLAEAEREKLSNKQNACCAMCNKPEAYFKNRLSVDHNHKSGQVRGLLCYRCNKFIVGRHSYESASKLLKYLEVEKQ